MSQYESLSTDDLRQLASSVSEDGKIAGVPQVGGGEGTDAEAYHELKLILLRQTLSHAYEAVPHYRRTIDSLNKSTEDFTSYAQLSLLPITTKDMLSKAPAQFLNRKVEVISWSRTRGTTGQPFTLPLSREELLANSFLRQIATGKTLGKTITLAVVFWRISVPVQPASPTIWVPYNFEDPQWARTPKLIDELSRVRLVSGGEEGRVSTLALPAPWLIRLMTKDLATYSVDPRDFAVRYVVASGGHATKVIRQLMKDTWNAEFFSSYNTAEVCGTATECALHDWYHFDISMIPEVLDPDTKEPVGTGKLGVLVLTTLHPFQQAMPLIRYWTDDLVIMTDEKCRCGFEGTSIRRFIGRRKDSLDLREIAPDLRDRKYLSPIDVYEIIDGIPELVYDRPLFRIDLLDNRGGKTLQVKVELASAVNVNRSHEIAGEIEEGIFRLCPELSNSNVIISTQFARMMSRYFDYPYFQT